MKIYSDEIASLGISVKWIADQLGVSRSLISQIIHGYSTLSAHTEQEYIQRIQSLIRKQGEALRDIEIEKRKK